METPEFCTPSSSPTPTRRADDGELASTAMHECVFADDLPLLARLVKSHPRLVDEQDVHGNTPLHLAVMLGRHNCVSLLISAGALVKIRNRQGWNAVMEAVSYGDRIVISALLRLLKVQSRDAMKARMPHMMEMFREMDDFYLELKWQFHSWLPLISRILPSDVCKIYKRGSSLRMDTTLVDFNERSWVRGDVSFVFNGSAAEGDKLVVLDNKAHCYQRVKTGDSEESAELDEEVDMLMANDVVNVQMSTKTVHFHRQVSGWVFREDRSETIGDYAADVYAVDGLCLVSHKRREHLSVDDLKNNKSLLTNFQRGKLTEQDVDNATIKSRASIPHPPSSSLTFSEYSSASSDECIGRPRVHKTTRKTMKASCAMSTEFPLDVSTLLDVLEVVAPLKHVEKLRSFCRLRMPPGFPVRVDMPIFPTVTATVTFQHMQIRDDIDPALFDIPKHYRLTTKRFPDL